MRVAGWSMLEGTVMCPQLVYDNLYDNQMYERLEGHQGVQAPTRRLM